MRSEQRRPRISQRTSWKDTILSGRFHWLAILLLFPSLLFATPVAAHRNAITDVQPILLSEAEQQPGTSFRVIVKRDSKVPGADNAVVRSGGTKLKDILPDYFVAILPGRAIINLAKNPSIDYITIDALMQTNATEDNLGDASQLKTLYPNTIGASNLWAQGTDGSGVGVAVIDTGIATVRDFSGASGMQGRIVAQQSFTGSSSTGDGYGHGTHVAGIIGGDSWWSSPQVQGAYIGVAPNVNLVNLRVADGTGKTYMSDVISAFEWAIANRVQYNIRVINLSMTSTVPESYHTSLLDAEAERAWFNGILVVVAAGNNGPNSMYYAPADDPFVVTVGATDANGTVQAGDDWIAPWSSSGTSPDGVTKPDVVAPGRLIVSTLAQGSEFAREYRSRIVDQNYIWMSGTSMSTAVVSGAAALIFQDHPGWTNDQVKWVLMQTATTLHVAPVTQGSGEVNAYAAVHFTGTPQSANQGIAINLNLIGPNGATIYNNLAPSGSAWSGSAWSGSAWSGSAWSGSAWSGSAWSGSAWSGSAWSGSAWSGGGDLR